MVAAYPLAPVRYKATDSNGQPLIGGKVYAYVAGSTTTPKDTYSDKNMGDLNTWPVVLDDAGSAAIYISGDYYFRIFDANDVLVEEGDGIADPESVAQAIFAAGSGTGNLESRVTDLETSRNEHTDRLNTLDTTTADLQTQITAETAARTAAITAAINSLRTELITEMDNRDAAQETKIENLKIKVGYGILGFTDTNPATSYGYGTWALEAQGEAIVGLSTETLDPSWTKTVLNSFGDYTQTLTQAQLPAMTAIYQKFTGQTVGDVSLVPIDGNGLVRYADNTTINFGGTGDAHSIVQPSKVVALWRRTA